MNLLARSLARHAATRPDAPALAAADRTLTYGELYLRATSIAGHLSRLGIGRGHLVGIVTEKQSDTVAAMVATGFVGAAYVPLDPAAPTLRARSVLDEVDPAIVLGNAAQYEPLPEHYVSLDRISGAPAEPVEVDPGDPCYVLYTSGSSGRPKGAVISFGAVAAFFEAVDRLMSVRPGSRCLNTSALHFDVSLVDLFYPLNQGAAVHLGGSVPIPGMVLRRIQDERITHMAAVGSTLTMLAEMGAGLDAWDLTSLEKIMTGAEVLRPQTVQKWLHAAPGSVVINGYGPTETTCLVTAEVIAERDLDRSRPYPIGTALEGSDITFLDARGEVSAAGPGEILIGGAQVMNGYLKPSPGQDPFLTVDGKRYYRSGDWGLRRADGRIEFHGRRDAEVKLRGYRVNLGEVESVVESHPRVPEAVVFVTDAPDRRIICAYRAADSASAEAIAEFTSRRLPRYMRPEAWIPVDPWPRLASGKPDRKTIRSLCSEQV